MRGAAMLDSSWQFTGEFITGTLEAAKEESLLGALGADKPTFQLDMHRVCKQISKAARTQT